MTADGVPLKKLIKAAKKEGKLNVIALPHDWANYGEIISTFKRKYGLKMDEANPNGSSSQENQAIRSLKGDSRAPDTVDVGPSFAIDGAKEGLYKPYKVATYKSIPKGMKDSRARWYGDYWGAIAIGYNANIIKPAPKTFKDLLKPAYKNRVAPNGNPLTSNSAVSGVFAAALANGGSLNNVGPGIDFFRQLKKAGNFIPVDGTPQTVASRPTASTARSTARRSTPARLTRTRLGCGWSSSTPTRGSCSGSRAIRTRLGSRISPSTRRSRRHCSGPCRPRRSTRR